MSNIQKANQFKTIGNQAFKNKNWQQAIKNFTSAIQLNPNDQVYYSNRSTAYLNLGKHTEALNDAQQCIKINPTWPRGYQRKGAAYFYMGKTDQAINAYQQGLKVDPSNAALQNDLKSAQAKKNQADGKQAQMLQAYMKLASNPQTQAFLSDPSFMQKVQALIQNPAAYSLFANDPQMMKAFEVISKPSSGNQFDFENLMKNMASKQGQNQNTKMDEQKPQPKPQTKPQPKPQPKKQQPKQVNPAQAKKNQGNAQYKKKNFQKAIQLYQQAIQLNPKQPLYYNNKAATYIQMGLFAQAHAQLDKAENLFSEGVNDYVKKAKVLARRASLLAKQKKYEQSIKVYQSSLLQDGVQKVRDQLKAVRKLKKQKDQRDYINPQLAEKACEEGNTLFKQGKFPNAISLYQQAIKRNPQVPKYHSNLGTAFIKLMQWPRAIQCFNNALKIDPNFIKAYPKKADCHFAMKQYHKALQVYEAGLKIDSSNQLCKLGISKTQNAIYNSNANATEQQRQARAQRAMSDPEIKQIMQTPEVINALNDLQANPNSIQTIMRNPSLAAKIQKLIQAGIIGTA